MLDVNVMNNNLRDRLIKDNNRQDDIDNAEYASTAPGEVVAKLYYFKTNLLEIPKCFLLCHFIDFYKAGLWTNASVIGQPLMQTAGYIFLNNFPLLEQASFGIFLSFLGTFYLSINMPVHDRIGLAISRALGEKDYAKCRKFISQGLLTVILLNLMTLPLMYYADKVLYFLGIAEANAIRVREVSVPLIPVLIILDAAEIIKTFCTALGDDTKFGYIGIPNAIIAFFTMHYFMVAKNLGILGWVYSRGIYECINLATSITVFIQETHPEARGLAGLFTTIDGFYSFFRESFFFACVSYIEYFATQVTYYFVTLSQNNVTVSVYNVISNFRTLFGLFGVSLCSAVKTQMAILIGQSKAKVALNIFIFYTVAIFLSGFGFSLLLIFGRAWIIRLFAGVAASSNTQNTFTFFIYMYAACVPCELTYPTSVIGIKAVGGVAHLVKYNLYMLILANGIGDFIILKLKIGDFLLRKFGGDSVFLFTWMFFLIYLVFSLCTYKTISADWRAIELAKFAQMHNYEEEMEELVVDVVNQRKTDPKKKLWTAPQVSAPNMTNANHIPPAPTSLAQWSLRQLPDTVGNSIGYNTPGSLKQFTPLNGRPVLNGDTPNKPTAAGVNGTVRSKTTPFPGYKGGP